MGMVCVIDLEFGYLWSLFPLFAGGFKVPARFSERGGLHYRSFDCA